MITEERKLNVYQKLAKARLRLKNTGLKQTGKNKGVGYTYFDLPDFLPTITAIEEDIGLLSCVSFFADHAELRVYDTETGNSISFESPMSTAELKSCHPVQNLGAVETYVRRYLYMAAYEIVESDALDMGQEEKNSAPKREQTPEEVALEKALKTTFVYDNYKYTLEEAPLPFLRGIVKSKTYESIKPLVELVIAHKEKEDAPA